MEEMKNLGRSVQRVASSSKVLSEASAEHHRKAILAAERATLMLDCWRTGGANNPEVFVTAVAATLARYPDEVIYAVTDPTRGLPVQVTWMPSVKEVRDACEQAYRPIVEHEARLKRIREQLEMRERMDRGERPTLAQLQERYGENWGIKPAKETITAEQKAEQNREALAKTQARVKREYEEAGMTMPSKFALSIEARRLIAQQDAAREGMKAAQEAAE